VALPVAARGQCPAVGAFIGRPRSNSRASERGQFAATAGRRAAPLLPVPRRPHGPHRARIGTCRYLCSRSSAPPESDRYGMVCYTILAYRRGRTCPRADHGIWSGRKLATTLAVGRRRRAIAVSRSWSHLADRASPLANRASKLCLKLAAASALSSRRAGTPGVGRSIISRILFSSANQPRSCEQDATPGACRLWLLFQAPP
jgi:hypothetical protein